MKFRLSRRLTVLAALAACVLAFQVRPLHAQRSGDGFLFGRPDAILNLHGGLSRPSANSEVFDFVTEILSVDKGDFLGGAAGVSLYFPLSSVLDLELSATYAGRVAASDYRELEGTDNLPIEQETQFIRVPLLIGSRYFVTPRERSIGSLVWIPADYALYVGAGAGAMWYRFRQVGEFVDFEDDSIFADDLKSEGWSPAAQLTGGVDVAVTTRIGVNVEANYLWGRATLDRDYSDFNAIDLSGFSALVGFSLRL